MKNIKISFEIKKLPFSAAASKNGKSILDIRADDGKIFCDIRYDYDLRPLRVSADVKEKDSVDLILMPHRIELCVNGLVKDEEWPAGKCLFEMDEEISLSEEISVEEYTQPEIKLPSVVTTFSGAEGWRPEENVFVGDCMPYRRNDEYHVLYLKDRHHHKSKWGLGAHQWEHISTKDFSVWMVHPMAVPISESWEGSICTGSWIACGEKEYLFYTVRRGRGLAAPISRSVSYDGYHFEKDSSFGFSLSERYNASSARDPKVVKGKDGLYHMFLTTTLIKENKGCLAHYVSSDMDNCREAGEPIYIADDNTEPECPDYICYKGRYYLIYSLHGRAHYLISDEEFDNWRVPEDDIIPCASVPKGAVWGDKLVFAGFKGINGYAGTLTFKSATAKENGELVFE